MIATNRPRAFSVCNSKDWPLMDIQRLRIAHTFTVLLARRMCENLNSRLGEGEMSPFGRERTDAFPVSKQEQAGASRSKQGSGLSLSHLMFMLFIYFLRNMIIKDSNVPLEFSSDFCAIFVLSVRFHQRPQAGVRSSIITYDVYVILNIIEKYDNNRYAPYAPYAFNEQPYFFG